MTTPQQLFDEARTILAKSDLDQYLKGFDGELVHLLLQNHIEKVKAADTYERTMTMIEEAIASHLKLGVSIRVQDFIWDVKDCRQLYEIYTRWRSILLEPVQEKPVALPINVPHFPAGTERVL